MNDISRYNYRDYSIYAIVVYDLEEGQIQFFQKIPVVNFSWMKAQVSTHIRHLLNVQKKQGKTLYNDLTDYNFTREIRVTSLKINKNALIVFYNSCIDFYHIGPIVLNLRDCVQILCETNKIEPNKLKKKYVDINTLLSDCLSCLNCYNRILIRDLEAFSGREVVYNENCFMHLINKSGLLSLFRNYAGQKKYMQEVNQMHNQNSSTKRKEAIISGLKFKVNNFMLKHHRAINSERYQKFNQKIDFPRYKIIKEMPTEASTDREESSRNTLLKDYSAFTKHDKDLEKKFVSCSFIRPSIHNRIGNKNEMNVSASSLNLVDLDFDTLKQKGMMTNNSVSSTHPTHILPSNSNSLGNYPDISNINSRIEQEKKNVIKSTFTKQNNNINIVMTTDASKNNQRDIEEKKEIVDNIASSLDFQTIAKINQSVIQMSNKQQSNDSSSKPKPNIIAGVNQKHIEPIAQSVMPIYNLISPPPIMNPANSSIQHSNNNSSWDDKKCQSQMVQTPTNKSAIMNSQLIIYHTSLNSSTNKNSHLSSNASSDLNIQRFSSQKASINNLSFVEHSTTQLTTGNINNNISNNNHYNPAHITQNKLGIFNSVGGYSINPNLPSNRVNQKMDQDESTLTNHRLSSSSLPPNNNRYTNSITTTTAPNFSEDDMSFLSHNNHQKKEYDDNIVLNKANPDLIGDLREKYFYVFLKGTLIKSDGKGYIGLNLRNNLHINKKLFSLMILQAKWKDHQYFSNKEFDHSILAKLTEVDYRLECKNVSQDLKMITYYPNPLKIQNLVAIKVKNDFNQINHQVLFEISFSFNQVYISNVYRMIFNMFLRKTHPQQKSNFKILYQNHQSVKVNDYEYRIDLKTVAKSISFTIESLVSNPIEKIQFCFEMKVSFLIY